MSKHRRPREQKAKSSPGGAAEGEAQAEPQSLYHRLFVRAFVIVAGAVIMVMEIVGSRILAPYFGNSVFIWGSLITVFLFALSLGYFLGGKGADRWPSRRLLGAVGLVGGLLILLIPFIADALCKTLVAQELGPRVSPLLACTFLFFLPSLVLAMTSPLAIRIEGTDLERLGKTAGTLYALSTLGSILGTIATAFFLIPAMGVHSIVVSAGCLSILAGLTMLPPRLTIVRAAVFVVVVSGGGYGLTLVTPDSRDANEIYAAESHYHNISVVEKGGERHLLFDQFRESGIKLEAPHDTVFMYTNMLHLVLIFTPEPERVLFIGGGGGVAPSRFRRDLGKDLWIDVVEIDRKVLDVSRDYFYFREDERLKAHAADGRVFIQTTDADYDIVVLDAFTVNGQVPFHLMTKEFLQELRAHLTDNGAVIMNLISGMYGAKGELYKAVLATFHDVFGQVYVFPRDYHHRWAKDPNFLRNIMIVGTVDTARMTPEKIERTAHRLVTDGTVTVPDFDKYVGDLLPVEMIQFEGVKPLTDDHAPVELLQPTR